MNPVIEYSLRHDILKHKFNEESSMCLFLHKTEQVPLNQLSPNEQADILDVVQKYKALFGKDLQIDTCPNVKKKIITFYKHILSDKINVKIWDLNNIKPDDLLPPYVEHQFNDLNSILESSILKTDNYMPVEYVCGFYDANRKQTSREPQASIQIQAYKIACMNFFNSYMHQAYKAAWLFDRFMSAYGLSHPIALSKRFTSGRWDANFRTLAGHIKLLSSKDREKYRRWQYWQKMFLNTSNDNFAFKRSSTAAAELVFHNHFYENIIPKKEDPIDSAKLAYNTIKYLFD